MVTLNELINTPLTTIKLVWQCASCSIRQGGSILSFIEYKSGPEYDKIQNKCYFCNNSKRIITDIQAYQVINMPIIDINELVELCRSINPGIQAYQVKQLYANLLHLYNVQQEKLQLSNMLKDVEQW